MGFCIGILLWAPNEVFVRDPCPSGLPGGLGKSIFKLGLDTSEAGERQLAYMDFEVGPLIKYSHPKLVF